MYQPTHVIESKYEIRAIFGEAFPAQMNKFIDHVDRHIQTWIERSPFVVVSTVDRLGGMDVSPRGDPPGFVKILDEKTLAIPDRPGNKRGDTFMNILETGRIGLMFVVPERKEVVRVNGTAQVVRDPDLLALMQVQGRIPEMAILVRVEEAFYHCGKAMIRSSLWKPEKWPGIQGLSTYAQALNDHAKPDITLEQMEARLARNEAKRLYDD